MASGTPIKIEQIDYYTMEHVDEYTSIFEAAEDNYMVQSTLSVALKKGKGEAVFKKKELRFRKITV